MTKQELLKVRERIAMNIVHQLDDDANLSVDFRQENNDKRIAFVAGLLDDYAEFVVREIMPKSRTLKLEGSQAYDIGWNECVNEAIDTAKDKFNIDI